MNAKLKPDGNKILPTGHRHWLCVALLLSGTQGYAASAMTLENAFDLARNARAELRVAAARIDAARQRPVIVSALDDPVVAPSIDHKPVDSMMKTDRSITFEQSFPLSRIRSHRRSAAEADVDRVQAEAARTALKLQSEVAQAFFMLNERRRLLDNVAQQIEVSSELIKVTSQRYATGAAQQVDVLRAEAEEARLRTRKALTEAEVRAAEAMFNTALGRNARDPVPSLQVPHNLALLTRLPDLDASRNTAYAQRAELRISDAEIRRSRAEIKVMKSMYSPMVMVRAGMADTMAAGRGYMLMVGISIPIWFDKLKAGVREADAMATMADADREAMLRMIDGDVAAAQESLRGAAAYYQSFKAELLPRAERAIPSAMAAYMSGTLPFSSALDANKALWSIQEDALMAEAALGLAWVRYCSAIGDFGELK